MAPPFLEIMDSFLIPEECATFIRLLDTADLESVDRGSLASYDRATWINAEFADTIYERLKGLVPAETVRCNEHFRFSKYRRGQEFNLHTDGMNYDKCGNESKYTVNIFLNSDFEGGETDFFRKEAGFLRAKPMVGRAVLFDREILHRGNMILSGVKYLLRTDVMVKKS